MRSVRLVISLCFAVALPACGPTGKRLVTPALDAAGAVGGEEGATPPGRGGADGSGGIGGEGGRGGTGGPGGDGPSPDAGAAIDAGIETPPADGAAPPEQPPAPRDAPADSAPPATPDRAVDLPGDLAPVPAPDAAAPPPAAGLVAYLKFDEGQGATARDLTAGNDGTLRNGANWQPGGFPGAKFPNSHSVIFDGLDDVVDLEIPGLPAIEAPKTISLWVRHDAAPAATGVHVFVVLVNDPARAAVQIGFRNGRLLVWRHGGGEIVGAPPPAVGWHHLLYTYDGALHALHVDGVPVATSTIAPQRAAVTSGRLGAWGAMGGESFKGAVDDLRIYDRALGAAEIAALRAGQ